MKFTKSACDIIDSKGRVILRGERTEDNCYCLNVSSISCNLSNLEQGELWHQRLGHMNFKDMKKIGAIEAVKGLPKLGKNEVGVCGPCQMGKQTKVAHKRTKDVNTKRPLELLHMDLVGPVQTESLGGKKYIFVCVDDFSRFTWVRFLREKSETFDVFNNLCIKLENEKESEIKSMV